MMTATVLRRDNGSEMRQGCGALPGRDCPWKKCSMSGGVEGRGKAINETDSIAFRKKERPIEQLDWIQIPFWLNWP
ncbi:hypothetical protein CEXT_67151 [Caerostris extrusa]|uniref:Uncharacterized protein n=1 Tax=Caerostris extrusa TaxID=172846 RepID=A0AAV4XXZ3_CAEEX|nr:hypothetical protein CEXT_67151 [Caerostris extrusa]